MAEPKKKGPKLVSETFTPWPEPSIPMWAVYYVDELGWRDLPVMVRKHPMGEWTYEDGTMVIAAMPDSDYWKAEVARLDELHPELNGQTCIIRSTGRMSDEEAAAFLDHVMH